MTGAASPQEQGQTPHIINNDPNEEGEEDELKEEEEEEEPTPTNEKDTPIPPATREDNRQPTEEEAEDDEVAEEEEGEGLNGADEENQEKEEDKVEEEEKGEEEEDKETEQGETETEEPKSKTEEGEAEEAEEETKQLEEDDEEDEEEDDYDDDEEEDEDEDTTADLLTDSNFSPIKPNNNKSNLAKTNGHVLLGSEGLKQKPVTPPPPSPTSEPLLCPLVESELSYTDRDNSLSSGYEMYNGELLEPGLTNGSSERHRTTMPFFPDLPLDPDPENPITVPGIADAGAGPSPNNPSADRSRTVSSSSTGDTPKGKEGMSPEIECKVNGGKCFIDASAVCVRSQSE